MSTVRHNFDTIRLTFIYIKQQVIFSSRCYMKLEAVSITSRQSSMDSRTTSLHKCELVSNGSKTIKIPFDWYMIISSIKPFGPKLY